MSKTSSNTKRTTSVKVKVNCVVLGTDISNNKQYILSLDDKEIVFPHLYIDSKNKENIELHITDLLKSHMFISELELMPQIISLNSNYIIAAKNEINTIYGFVVKHTISIDKAHWIPFDYSQANPYSNLIFEVIQKLR
jgi:hypothetical protein